MFQSQPGVANAANEKNSVAGNSNNEIFTVCFISHFISSDKK